MTTPTSYTATNWLDTAAGQTPLSAANLNKIEQGIVNAYVRSNLLALTPTIVRTGSYTLNANDYGRFDCSAQQLTSTLPPATVGMLIGMKKMDATANTAVFNTSGSDVIDGSATSLTLRLQNEGRILCGVTGGWVILSGVNTIASLDTRYAAPPIFYAVQAATQSISNNIVTPLTWPTESIDTANGHSISTTTSRYVCQQAGWYWVSGVVNYITQNTTGVRSAYIYKNATEYPGGSSQVLPTAVATRVATPTILVQLALNDYVELEAFQTSGVTTTTEATATTGSSFTVVFERP